MRSQLIPQSAQKFPHADPARGAHSAMIKKFLSKYLLEVIPSIVATVVGAYIVTNYINAKPPAEKPPAAVSSQAPAETLATLPAKDDTAAKAEAAAKAAETKAASERLANEKAAAIKAAAEKAATEKAEARRAAERLASEKREAEKRELERKEAERHEAEKREHVLAKVNPSARTPAVKPIEESAANPDANDLARAAIARLRAEQPMPVAQPVTKMPEHPVAPVIAAPGSQPAAPPMREANINPTEPMPPAAVAPLPTATIATTPPVADVSASRMVPPADIPLRPLDLQPSDEGKKDNGSVVSDMMSATKSAFQAVLPR